MNKEATMRWKRRFDQELLEIRRRVIADKLLAAQAKTAPRVRRIRKPKAPSAQRRSRYFTGASFAKDFRDWFAKQTQFQRQLDLAGMLEVDSETVSSWLNSKKFPKDRFCEKLFRFSGLNCFSPAGRIAARREHRSKKVQR
jgi:hypothetical protein